MEKKIKILPPTYFLFLLILEVLFHLVFPIKHIISYPYNYFGIFFICFGIFLNLSADSIFKKEKTDVKPGQNPRKIITEGPFKLSRNPMYLGMVIALFGVSVYLGSLVSFIFPIILFIIINQKFISLEEKIMEKRFDKKYSDYKKKVRRWI